MNKKFFRASTRGGAGNLANRVALITGAAGGLGSALCNCFLRAGAQIVALDINANELNELIPRLDASDRKVCPLVADISKVAECRRAVSETLERFGRLDVLVNNAAICPRVPIPGVTEDLWDKTLGVNLKGVFFLSQAASQAMRRARSGRIVNISSTAARTGGMISASVYAATKAGVVALTKSFARELAPYRISVNAVAPGMFESPLITELPQQRLRPLIQQVPLGRIAKPEEIAHVVVFLASDQASYMTGVTVDVNGGLLMF